MSFAHSFSPAFRSALLAAISATLLLVACDGPAAGDEQPADSEAGIVGAWWRFLPGAPGMQATQVFELRPDGVFVTFAPDALQDRGRYRLAGDVLHVESDLNPALKGDLRYRLSGADRMTLTIGPPLNQVQEWKRVSWPANFGLAEVGGYGVPRDVDGMVARTVLAVRDWWRADAVPERLEFQALKNLDMRATLDLCSPADGACLRGAITRYEAKFSPYQTPPGRTPAFPADFIDLAAAVEKARRLGYDGRLTRAGIGLGSPNWGLRFTGGKPGTAGLVLDGLTGERVTYDMNEVMADYNRQWDTAIANLRQVFQKNTPAPADDNCPFPLVRDTLGNRCIGDQECTSIGGNPQFGSCSQ